jgi:hypothetical protein
MATVPGPPQITLRPRASDQTLQFWWATPVSDGGSAITGYTLVCTAASYSQVLGPTTYTYKVTGLTNGTPYSFYLIANNAIGSSAAAYFRTVEPGFKASAPQTATAVADGSNPAGIVSWTAPTSDGGAEIGWYVIHSNSSDPADPIKKICTEPWKTEGYVGELNPASTYTFKVYAVNDPGYGPAAITNSITLENTLLVSLTASNWSGTGPWLDATSNNYDATLADGTAALNAAGNGIVLDGSTYWTFPNIGSQSVWTISVWFKRTGNSTDSACMVTEEFTGGSINISILSANSGAGADQFAGGFFNSGFKLGTPITFPLNEWHQMTTTWDGTNIITYYDSVVNSTINEAGQISLSTSLNLYRIGRRWDLADYVTGEIGEVLIHSVALSPAAVAAHYASTSPTYI